MTPLNLIPDSAPFTAAQRAWLNGFIAGLLSAQADSAGQIASPTAPSPAPQIESFTWHDPTLGLDERMGMAEGRPLAQRLMAAMGQLDCGQCGYDCHRYASAIAEGTQSKLTLCVPGGKPTQRVLKQLMAREGGVPASSVSIAIHTANTASPAVHSADIGTRENPVSVPVVESRRLTSIDSDKETRFISIDLTGSGVHYDVGDSLGIYPENSPELVDAVMRALKAPLTEQIKLLEGGEQSLRLTLLQERELRTPSEELYALLADYATNLREKGHLTALLRGDESIADSENWDVLDVLERFPSARPPASAVAVALEPLRPRLYSISSSLKAHPGQVHLTVAVVRYAVGERRREGAASAFLADRAMGRAIRIFVQPSHGFRLPKSGDTPIIMIGPGTGVAPFRAFLAERKACRAPGRNWIFFGERRKASDFLYREEFETSLSDGTLTRLDTAFSRDQPERVYVQQRMAEQGAELWNWLQQGAHVYVCGDAKQMAGDVHRMLHDIISQHGGLTEAQAKEYLARMTSDQRYQRDVY